MTRMNTGGPEWRKWCAEYEGSTRRERERAERRVKRDAMAIDVEDEDQ